jgi:hypothetical protein
MGEFREAMKEVFRNVWVVLFIIFIFSLISSSAIIAYSTQDYGEITIKKTLQKRSGDTDRYLIFTENNGVFENTDCVWLLKFNSSDIQSELEEGKTYKIKYYGWRVRFLSWYPNIITLTSN